MQSTWYCCQILAKLEFSPHIFKKSSNTKVHATLSSGAELFHMKTHTTKLTMWTSGFHREVAENQALQGYYTANCSSVLQMCLKRHRLHQFA